MSGIELTIERRPALAALLLAWALIMSTAVQAAPQIDEPAPALRGVLFSGAEFDLARMGGKVVLVNFYSSYCKFCAYEIGLLSICCGSNVSACHISSSLIALAGM